MTTTTLACFLLLIQLLSHRTIHKEKGGANQDGKNKLRLLVKQFQRTKTSEFNRLLVTFNLMWQCGGRDHL